MHAREHSARWQPAMASSQQSIAQAHIARSSSAGIHLAAMAVAQDGGALRASWKQAWPCATPCAPSGGHANQCNAAARLLYTCWRPMPGRSAPVSRLVSCTATSSTSSTVTAPANSLGAPQRQQTQRLCRCAYGSRRYRAALGCKAVCLTWKLAPWRSSTPAARPQTSTCRPLCTSMLDLQRWRS